MSTIEHAHAGARVPSDGIHVSATQDTVPVTIVIADDVRAPRHRADGPALADTPDGRTHGIQNLVAATAAILHNVASAVSPRARVTGSRN